MQDLDVVEYVIPPDVVDTAPFAQSIMSEEAAVWLIWDRKPDGAGT